MFVTIPLLRKVRDALVLSRCLRGIGFATGLALVCSSSGNAAASKPFPPRILKNWGITRLPVKASDGCTLCHTTDPGVMGTANQKFAATMKSLGLESGDVDTLDLALDKVKKTANDSDKDGFSDYEEIVVDSTNPNDATSHRVVTQPPPPPEGGAGGQSNSAGGAGGVPDEGDEGGAASLPECIPSKTIYPSMKYGCNFRRADDSAGPLWPLAGALVWFARRKRERR